MENPYKAPGLQNCERKGYYIDGPGDGFGYYAGYLWPDYSFITAEQAEIVAKMCNEAYRCGYWAAQNEMRKALGLK